MISLPSEPPAIVGDARDVRSIPGLRRSLGGWHGNPLQYSCLEIPMDRGAWQAIVHGITRSQTWLKWLSRQIQRLGAVEVQLRAPLPRCELTGWLKASCGLTWLLKSMKEFISQTREWKASQIEWKECVKAQRYKRDMSDFRELCGGEE